VPPFFDLVLFVSYINIGLITSINNLHEKILGIILVVFYPKGVPSVKPTLGFNIDITIFRDFIQGTLIYYVHISRRWTNAPVYMLFNVVVGHENLDFVKIFLLLAYQRVMEVNTVNNACWRLVF
jgi:hypothetical protein